jgi:hypothetical protein
VTPEEQAAFEKQLDAAEAEAALGADRVNLESMPGELMASWIRYLRMRCGSDEFRRENVMRRRPDCD